MPRNVCIICRKTVRRRQHAIECESCERWQHRVCGTGINVDVYREAVKGLRELTWR